jgi:hypothetical protein
MKKVFVLSIDMGYGHQRTAYALQPLAMRGEIINANSYKGIPDKDRELWASSQSFYEFVSRFKKVPVLGSLMFAIFDKTQAVENFYTTKNLSNPSFTQRGMYPLFDKGWGEHLIESLRKGHDGKKAPAIVSTFFTTAFMAEYFNYPGDIFCVVCDTDISRSWAPLRPKDTRIKYFAPTERAYDRLKMYGVPERNIYLTGYPLPLENIGKDLSILKEDVRLRISNLDPNRIYQRKYGAVIEKHLGSIPSKPERPLTIAFAVGGAGAQKEYGIEIARAFAREIRDKMIKLVLVAGTKAGIKDYFNEELKRLRLDNLKGVEVLYAPSFEEYYDKFNKMIRKADLLWTKPSELSFYANLGLPIIIAPTIGSHEDINKQWILESGFGFEQKDIGFVKQWLMDEVREGNLAKMAMQGYIEGNQLGVLKIKEILNKCCG